MAEPLPDECLSVPGCERPRLPYAGYCRDHGPNSAPVPDTRCQAPVRCYCPACCPPKTLGPQHGPESIRLMLDELARRRARRAERVTSVL